MASAVATTMMAWVGLLKRERCVADKTGFHHSIIFLEIVELGGRAKNARNAQNVA